MNLSFSPLWKFPETTLTVIYFFFFLSFFFCLLYFILFFLFCLFFWLQCIFNYCPLCLPYSLLQAFFFIPLTYVINRSSKRFSEDSNENVLFTQLSVTMGLPTWEDGAKGPKHVCNQSCLRCFFRFICPIPFPTLFLEAEWKYAESFKKLF